MSKAYVVTLIHIVWPTKYRAQVLVPQVDEALGGILGRKAKELGCYLIAAGNSSDHVHVLAGLASPISLAQLVHQLKGGSAYEVNRQQLMPHHLYWGRYYWAASVSPRASETVKNYITNQRQHHKSYQQAESWENTYEQDAPAKPRASQQNSTYTSGTTIR